MKCPYCAHEDTKVVDKRDFGDITRRRRECKKCGKRFSTRESVERAELRVVKKDGSIEAFDHEKLKRGVMKACEKRPVGIEKIEKMLMRIEDRLRKKGKEVRSAYIGELVSRELKKLDKVAYIRFASVYREFGTLDDFKEEIKKLTARS
ncbi:transcriptional repressor NrdR [Candidatus Pacearchaeota archaeon]|nr:MAG: transcriptional repressor NrdR [Candidatus Pacearchaeota archaeon]